LEKKRNIFKKTISKDNTNKKNKIYVFLICIIISSFIWFLIKMSKDYSYEFEYHINYTNETNSDAFINQPDTSITIVVKTQGFKLLRMFLKERDKSIDFDLSRLEFNNKDTHKEAYVNSHYILRSVIDEYHLKTEEYFIRPDSLFYRTNVLASKKLPIVLNADIQCKSPYNISGKIVLKPDSVVLYATEEILKNITEVETQYLEINDLESSKSTVVLLVCEYGRLSMDKIIIDIPVEKYTEKNIVLPIEVRYDSLSLLKETELKIFPTEANIKLNIPMQAYTDFKLDNISAFVDYNTKLKNNDRLKIEIDGLANDVNLIRINPQTVEFIIIK
jgi:hypothetical protein